MKVEITLSKMEVESMIAANIKSQWATPEGYEWTAEYRYGDCVLTCEPIKVKETASEQV